MSTENTAPVDAGAAAPDAGTASPPSNVATLADDALLEFTVGGEKVQKPWSEVRQTQAMLPSDYTRKMQALADQRREFESLRGQFEQERSKFSQSQAEFQSIINDPQKLSAFYLASVAAQQSRQGQTQQPNQVDLAALLQRQSAALEEKFEAFQTAQRAAKIEEDLGSYAGGLLKADPALAALDGIEEAVFAKVTRMNPSSIEEAKEYTKLVVDQMIEKHNGALAGVEKEKALSKSKLSGIEPKGGSPKPTAAKKYGGIDDPDRMSDMIAFMQQALAGDE